jgi:hypothetical protein
MALIIHEGAPPTTPKTPTGLSPYRAVIAIPAKDEEEFLGVCLASLAEQTVQGPFAVLILLNNCTDASLDVLRAIAPTMPFDVHVHHVKLDPPYANAAWARRLAMNAALRLLDRDGVLFTTDADSRAQADWMEASLSAIDAGADVACGFVVPDPSEHEMPLEAVLRGAMEFEYAHLSAELSAHLDPLDHDPWPHHVMETGASLAVRPSIYVSVGGIPHVAPGEDRLFVDTVRRAGGKIRHTLTARVVTSSRLNGRAEGGWSDNLRDRLSDPFGQCHELLEPVMPTFRRARLRGGLRAIWGAADACAWARRLELPLKTVQQAFEEVIFEAGWSRIEGKSPVLLRAPLMAPLLPVQLGRLRRAVEQLRTWPDDYGAAQTAAARFRREAAAPMRIRLRAG